MSFSNQTEGLQGTTLRDYEIPLEFEEYRGSGQKNSIRVRLARETYGSRMKIASSYRNESHSHHGRQDVLSLMSLLGSLKMGFTQMGFM